MVPDITDLPRAIQLALTPVFLLTGIGGLLSVMSGRLSRIVDRGRALARGDVALEHVSLELEAQTLEQRRRLASAAITATTIGALSVCLVIAAIFIEVMLQTPLQWVIGAFFALTMLALVVGLTFLLRETHVAMHTLRIAAPSRGDELTTRRPAPIAGNRYSMATESRRFAADSPRAAHHL
jgi:MFS family permease